MSQAPAAASEALSPDYRAPDSMLAADRASTELLGMTVVEMSEGRAVVTMPVRADMVNGHSIVHGGLVFSLADTAFAMACNQEGSVTVSSGAEITYFAPGHAGDVLTATAVLRSRRGRSGIYDVEVRNEHGLLAEFRGHSRTITGEKVRKPDAAVPDATGPDATGPVDD